MVDGTTDFITIVAGGCLHSQNVALATKDSPQSLHARNVQRRVHNTDAAAILPTSEYFSPTSMRLLHSYLSVSPRSKCVKDLLALVVKATDFKCVANFSYLLYFRLGHSKLDYSFPSTARIIWARPGWETTFQFGVALCKLCVYVNLPAIPTYRVYIDSVIHVCFNLCTPCIYLYFISKHYDFVYPS